METKKPSGGKRARDKGMRVERRIVNDHKELGVKAERVPLSGAAVFRNTASTDVDIYIRGDDADPWVTEVKARANGSGWKTIEEWLGNADALFLVQDRKQPLVVLPWEKWKEILENIKKVEKN